MNPINAEVTETVEVSPVCMICIDAPIALDGDALNRPVVARLPFCWYDLGFAASMLVGAIMIAVHMVAR